MATTDDLLDLPLSIGQRASEVRFDLLDQSLDVIGQVQPDLDTRATVAVNINRTIKRTLEGIRLNAAEGADVNPFGDRLRPVWVLENGAEFNLGVFILGGIDRTRWEWGLDADVSGVDQTLILDQAIEQTVALPAGGDVRTLIEAQFAAANVPTYEIDPGIATTAAAPIAWPAGTSRLQVINDLAAMAGAYSAYFDNDGVGRVTLVPDLASATPDHVYDAGGRILAGSMVETDDLLDAANRYVVIDSSNPDSLVVGYYDVPDDAPHSFASRGFRVVKVIEEQGLGTVAAAKRRAEAAYAQDRSAYEWVQFSSPPDPRHDTFDVVAFLGTLYREQGWTLPLVEGGEMIHDLRRVYGAL